jgi:hypothetical protein
MSAATGFPQTQYTCDTLMYLSHSLPPKPLASRTQRAIFGALRATKVADMKVIAGKPSWPGLVRVLMVKFDTLLYADGTFWMGNSS